MIVFYDPETMLEVGTVDCAYPLSPEERTKFENLENGPFVEVPPRSPEFWYVHEGEYRIRPQLTVTWDKQTVVADGEDVVTISGIPAGAKVKIQQADTAAAIIHEGGDLPLSFLMPGDAFITIEHLPYQKILVAFKVD